MEIIHHEPSPNYIVEIGPIEGTFNDLGEIIESKHATVKADRRLLYYYAYNYSKLACAPGIPGIRAIKFDTVTGVTIEVFLLWLRREYEIDKAENIARAQLRRPEGHDRY